MGQVLYRKYRSRTWDEVVGQEHVTTTLKHAIEKNIISHAYLFTGPRGVGKTSVARILAYAVNDMPYKDDSTQLDIIEIDAASNRRIDEIRELRERVHITPTIAKYKVYIVDEVHMLTREAFNALLKILEEPPEHVIFILATTEPHKLPETIVSRTQHFSFHPIDADTLTEHLKLITKKENITIDDDALQLIAEHGEGSFRDSISLLDQIRGYNKKISADDVHSLIGNIPSTILKKLLQSIIQQDRVNIITQMQNLLADGYESTRVSKQLASLVREDVLANKPLIPSKISFDLLKKLIDVPSSIEPAISLEITLLEAVDHKPIVYEDLSNNDPVVNELTMPKEGAQLKTASSQKVQVSQPEKETVTAEITPKPHVKKNTANTDQLWDQLLDIIKKDHNTLYGILRMAKSEFSESLLTLHFGFKFHQQKVKESKNCQILAQVLYELTAQNYTIECVVDESVKHRIPVDLSDPEESFQTSADNERASTLETINSIFGGGELEG